MLAFDMFSIAAHSTWTANLQHGFVIDAGEGIATHLGVNKIGAVNNVLLTHDHYDHIAGLTQFLNLRSRVAQAQPLAVFYPYDSRKLDGIRRLVQKSANWVRFKPGDKIRLSSSLFAVPIPVRHAEGKAVGFQVWDARTQLKAAYRHMSTAEIRNAVKAMLAAGKEPDINEAYDFHCMTYTGDTRPLSPDVIGRPALLIHEATYPNAAMLDSDRDHSMLPDALAARDACGAEKLVVNHLSTRYREAKDVDFKGAHVVEPIPCVQSFGKLDAGTLPGRSGAALNRSHGLFKAI